MNIVWLYNAIIIVRRLMRRNSGGRKMRINISFTTIVIDTLWVRLSVKMFPLSHTIRQ